MSFYSFLYDSGMRCCTFGKTLCKGHCLLKVKAFFRMALHNKILSLEILGKRSCSHISIITYTLCHAAVEDTEHPHVQFGLSQCVSGLTLWYFSAMSYLCPF